MPPDSLTVSIDGSCGQTTTCLGSTFGTCCSQRGYCGSTPDYCAITNNCQASFGLCGENPQVVSTTSSQTATPTPSSLNSVFGNCCSNWGWCGTSEEHCSVNNGCQNGFGVCGTNSPPPPPHSTSSPSPVPTLKVSVDGSCGKGVTCLGSRLGECCSQSSFCGSSSDYCGIGCQNAFGRCDKTAINPGTNLPPAGPKVSVDGSCGNGVSCSGSTFGDCCSRNNFCGSSPAYCSVDQGCQGQFGTCAKSQKVSTDGICGPDVTCQGSIYGNCCSGHNFCGTSDEYCKPANGCQLASGICH
ncbi:hypothetical protein BJ875DRAFT_477396 [Amylocarpus encephaloides]|uniref:Chitin-binding type-1 domain-containing protein n=1 Tax=Amylocarpus encephaloides TaxID=45428 RepID=A0A9P8BZK5_9HELO|nr:hypothetical protein BJ875DRAFT_477396 [Amylocarpus encephaloides]